MGKDSQRNPETLSGNIRFEFSKMMKYSAIKNGQNQIVLNKTIAEMYELPFAHPASVHPAVGNLFYSLTRVLKPKLIVEIGSFIGISTLYFAQALKENGEGIILGIDLFEPFTYEENVIQPIEIANYYKEKAELTSFVKFIKGDSSIIKPQILKDINGKIDLLYIDGDHTILGSISDFNYYYQEVKIGGYIIIHDIYPEKCGWDGPRVLINRLKKKKLIPKDIELTEIDTIDGYNFAFLHRISERPIIVKPGWKIRLREYLKNSFIKQWSVSVISKFGLESHIKKLYRIYLGGLFRERNYYPPVHVEISVYDKENGKPIPNVILLYPKRSLKVKSDEDGIFLFDKVPVGKYYVDFFAEGYRPKRNIPVTVDGIGPLQKLTIELTRK